MNHFEGRNGRRQLSQCQQQAEFMTVMGSPTVETHGRKAIALAYGLIDEEVNGKGEDVKGTSLLPAITAYLANPSLENLVNVADGAVDSIYVIYQLCNAIGLPFDDLFAEVHRSNMAKVHPDGTVKRREDGKILKPEGWQPPNLHAILLEWSTYQQYGEQYMRDGHVK